VGDARVQDASVQDARAQFQAGTARLARRARLRLVLRRGAAGLFYGLLPGWAAALLAGTVALPVPALQIAAGAAAAGLCAGVASAVIVRMDKRRLLIRADAALGSREVLSTAIELQRKPVSAFTQAVVEDAAALLLRTRPRDILGRPRLGLAPYAALAAALTAAALAFPVDLRALLPRSAGRDRELAQIGEDLRKKGEKLAEDARQRDLGRSLELSQQLAQLGRDLVDRRVTPDEAMDRMSELESGLSQEYQLRTQQVQSPDASGIPEPGTQGNADSGTSDQPGQKGQPGADRAGKSGAATDDPTTRELGDALDQLRQAQRDLRRQPGQRGGSDQAQTPQGPSRRGAPMGQGHNAPGSTGTSDQQDADNSPGGQGRGSGTDQQPGQPGSSGIGTQAAPEKRGPASAIIDGDRGPSLQARGSGGQGDSTRLLARSLPEWTGSRLPEDTILNRYSRQAESALARDEIPLELRQSVKEYFTSIGVTK